MRKTSWRVGATNDPDRNLEEYAKHVVDVVKNIGVLRAAGTVVRLIKLTPRFQAG